MFNFEEYTLIIKETDREFYTEVPENRFVAHLKEIPEGSLYDYGSTQEEAINNLRCQFGILQAEYSERSLELPKPEKKEMKDYSGRMVLRMPRWLHKQVTELAEDEEISINTYIISRLISNTSVENLFIKFCQLEQKLFEELPYKFNWLNTTCIEQQKISAKIFSIGSNSSYKIGIKKEQYKNVI